MIVFLVERIGFYGYAFLHQQQRPLLAGGVLLFQLFISVTFFTELGRRVWSGVLSISRSKKWLLVFGAGIFSLAYLGVVHTFADFYELTLELFWIVVFWTILILMMRGSARALGVSIAVTLVPQVLIAAEVALLLIGVFAPRRLDYPDVYGELGPGGFLRPNIDAQVVGERGLVQWKTNSAGFRNDTEFSQERGPDRYRILLGGDSFVAGYRVDQQQTIGYVLEKQLGEGWKKTGKGVVPEVMISCLEDPHAASGWLEGHLERWRPNMLIYCVTIANDAPQVYMRAEKDYDRYMLPPEAFERAMPGVKQVRRYGIAFFRFSEIGRRMERAIDHYRPVAITSQFNDTTGRVHVFDFYHGLGQFYTPMLPEVERALNDLNSAIERMQAACAASGTEFRVVIFPQRHQVDDENWRATVKRYGLDAGRFDLMQPNRRIVDFCAKSKIACLDLTPAFAQAAPKQSLFMPMGDMHFNADGDALAAQLIAEWL